MTKLPNAEQAIVARQKITQYLLKSDHPDNGGKAKFFAASGFGQNNADLLEQALRQHPLTNDVFRISRTEFGVKYVVQCCLRSPGGRNPCINTVWIDDGAGAPRFVTAYPAG